MIQATRRPMSFKLASAILEGREDHNLSQQALATLVGVSRKTIMRAEAGAKGVCLGTYQKLLEALEVEVIVR